jgi:hypothetical protein
MISDIASSDNTAGINPMLRVQWIMRLTMGRIDT